MKITDRDSSENQDIKRKLVNREVIYCVSNLVYELAQKAESFPEYYDELLDAYQGLPDYEECASDKGWTKSNPDFNEEGNYINKESGEISDVDSWQELCEEHDYDAYDYAPEIYEHWIITDYLADKLESHGHRVLRDFFGMTIWCRPTTGQAILLDGVISDIAEEMEILKGQKNDWSK
jgi:hypothetical protein